MHSRWDGPTRAFLRRNTACPRVVYSTPVWYYAITRAQTEQLESIQSVMYAYFPSHVTFPTHTHCLLLISTLRVPGATTFQSHSFKTFVTHLPAFTTSSHPHATLQFYPASEQSRLAHAYPPVKPILHYTRIK